MRWCAAFFATSGLLVASPALAADFYVSEQGSDGNDGSQANPFRTFAYALGQAGTDDSILLERGGTYTASNVQVYDLTVSAYGVGPDPILTASERVDLPDSWGMDMNVRTGAVPSEVFAVYVDGRFVRRARYPNTGFLRVDNQDPDTIVDAELANRPGVAPGRWTGAQVRWRRWSWWWETRPITDHAANDTLTLGPDGRFQDPYSDAGSGYFIDGDLDELDVPGEWHWENGTLYVYPPSWADPASMQVDVVTNEDTGVRAGNASFSQVHFTRHAGTALELQGPTTITDCQFTELETIAVLYTWNAQPFSIRRSIFRDVRNTSVTGWADPNGQPGTIIERNLFHRIGVERGYGGSGSWHAAGMILGNGSGLEVTLNRIVDTGYAGVILGGDGHRVYRNVFVRPMQTLNDGAAVYTNCNASDIRENIILDPIGDLEYSHPWWPLAHGIWPEFLGSFRDTQIVGNTIFGPNGFGIFLPNNFDCTVQDNLTVGARQGGLQMTGNSGDQQNHVIADNVLASLASPAGRIVRPENVAWGAGEEPLPVGLQYESHTDYGSMQGTTFVVADTGTGLVRADQTDYSTVGAWTSAASWADGASTSVVQTGDAVLVFNDTELSADVPTPAGAWTYVDGSAVGAAVPLEPFASALLLTNGTWSGPPYIAASGIDWRLDEPTDSYLTLEPEIAVSRGGAPVLSGATDDIGPTALSGTALTYSIRNQGGADLALGAPSISGETNCSVTVSAAPSVSVAPSGATQLGLQITSPAAGPWSFSVALTTNDTDENPTTWTISGTAQAGPIPDAGVRPDAGSVTPDTGVVSPDAGVVPPDAGPVADVGPVDGGRVWESRAIEGGCTCAAPRSTGFGWLWGLGLLAFVRRRRL